MRIAAVERLAGPRVRRHHSRKVSAAGAGRSRDIVQPASGPGAQRIVRPPPRAAAAAAAATSAAASAPAARQRAARCPGQLLCALVTVA